MINHSSSSRFRPGFIPFLFFLVFLFFLISIGPGSTQGLAAQVTLAWDAHTDPAVAGYKLYYGTASRAYGTPVDVGKVTQYTLTGIQEGINCYFAVTAYDANRNESAFSTELECFTLVPAPAVNGAINPSNAVVVSRGMNQTFTVTPAANYSIADVLVNAGSVGPVATYTFSNVSQNNSLSASFASVGYSHIISASAGVNGTISPSGSVSVSQGGSQTFVITANTGYQVADVKVDGTSVGAVASYTFTNVTSARSIAASFVAKTYVISASAGSNGAISPTGSVSVSHGASQAFTITANPGYQVADVKVDGTSVGALSSYTFTNVTAARSIAA
ncbi:MAG: fibronectin type III domain-containing protein, partial [Desulfatirhabdiaceae bacterium]|nr:fibronectin type III domain-containing protein [Desulfatirhabdiaceae bacterium]